MLNTIIIDPMTMNIRIINGVIFSNARAIDHIPLIVIIRVKIARRAHTGNSGGIHSGTHEKSNAEYVASKTEFDCIVVVPKSALNVSANA